jgi:transcriptional regulator with PAS, ATPase and Fis domain
MPEAMQRKMLRVLQEKELRPIGSEEHVKLDVRIVSATNRDLRNLVERKEFREDLYYRLKVAEIYLPPLRERREDIPLLINYFLEQSASKGKPKKDIEPAAMDLLLNYDWPGNVRELENLVHTLVLFKGHTITKEYIQPGLLAKGEVDFPSSAVQPSDLVSLEEQELTYIKKVLEVAGGSKTKASRILKIHRNTLNRKLEKMTDKNNLP